MATKTISEKFPPLNGRRGNPTLNSLLLVTILTSTTGVSGSPGAAEGREGVMVPAGPSRLSTAVVGAKNAPTECRGASGFWHRDLDLTVRALAVYDDGNGPALYAGGQFTMASGVTVNGIAKWDGSAWSPLTGPDGTGTETDGIVYAMAVYDDGGGEALYAGGSFTTAGGVTVNSIAKWDGSAWSSLSGTAGTGTSDRVRAVAVYDDGSGEALYVGGKFDTAGGVTVNGIAKWDGTTWSALSSGLGPGPSPEVLALAVYDDGSGEAIYAAGGFSTAGGVTVNRIARWDGSAWSPLSSGLIDGNGYAMAVYDDGGGEALYVGGSLVVEDETQQYSNIVRWDGSAWSGLSSEGLFAAHVWTLAVYDDGGGEAIYAGGWFYSGDQLKDRIARWDGTAWSGVIGPKGTGIDEEVHALAVYDDGNGEAIYTGGSFTTAGGVAVNRIARWDGAAWSPLSRSSGNGLNDPARAFAVYDDGSGEALYVGGSFTGAGGVTVNHIARWDGTAWSALSGPGETGTNGPVYALAVYDDGSGAALYAGGSFTTAGGVAVNSIAKWDGTRWSALSDPSGPEFYGVVYALAVIDDGNGEALYAGGRFNITGSGLPPDKVVKWDGKEWSMLSGLFGNSGRVYALAVYDDGSGEALYAGGFFYLTYDSLMSDYIAKWDGTAWSKLGESGILGVVEALTVFDDGSGEALHIGGDFDTADGVTVNGIAKWDGEQFSALSAATGAEPFGRHTTLAVYDDGSGEALYVAGWFNTVGGETVSGIAKWDGGQWSVLSELSDDFHWINAMAGYDDGGGEALYIGGGFNALGGTISSNITRWTCEPTPALYLNNDRFRVEATWRDFTGQIGRAEPVELTDDSGYFWFFDQENIEIVVKVLDACVSPYDRFWVFAAGLTNVEVTMIVTDTVTQTRNEYHNLLNQPFAPILDTDAFATCNAKKSRDVAAPQEELTSLEEVLRELNLEPRNRTTGADELVLNQDRFRVTVSWRDFAGQTGVARGVELTDQSGYFWFFDPENIEIVIKVLNACVDPYHKFWVFAAGMTNVEVTMTVTDTVTGEEKQYNNPLSQEFAPVLDTDAFATCGASP